MKKLAVLLLSSAITTAFAQKEVRTYYDPQKTKIQEVYHIDPKNPDEIVGKYQRYYENGTVMLEGSFEDGEKSGLFVEYHENGKPARKLSYINGLRHGRVEVFNDDGKPVQKAYYQN